MKNGLNRYASYLQSVCIVLFLGGALLVSGCNTTRAGITKIDIKRNMMTGDVEVHGEFGKEYEDFTARVEKGSLNDYSVYIHFGKAQGAEVLREAMETQKKMIGMFEKFSDTAMSVMVPGSGMLGGLSDAGPEVIEDNGAMRGFVR